MKGWGAGTLQEIKDKREEKLKLLDQAYQSSENELTRQVQRDDLASREKMNAAQLASQEKLTGAQLGVQERLGQLSAETSKSNAQLAATVNREELGVRRELTQAQLENSKELATLAADSAQQLNIKPVQYTTKAGKSLIRMERPDGTALPQPKDEQGNELTYLSTDTDTPDIKNMKSLMALGVPQEKAISTIFEAKNANRELAEAGIFKSITDGMSTMKNLGESDIDFAKKKAREVTEGIYGAEGTPAPTGTKPDVSSATEKQPTLTPAEKQATIAKARELVASGKSKADIRKKLVDLGLNPSEAGL